MCRINGVLETCLYARDLAAAERFFGGVFALELIAHESDRHVFFRCGAGMLLIFNPDRTRQESGSVGDAEIPPHGCEGSGHLAFAVEEKDLDSWKARLIEAGVDIESEVTWPRGGQSIYFRDPAGNSIELTSPVIWGW